MILSIIKGFNYETMLHPLKGKTITIHRKNGVKETGVLVKITKPFIKINQKKFGRVADFGYQMRNIDYITCF